jgi:hypothetical protein
MNGEMVKAPAYGSPCKPGFLFSLDVRFRIGCPECPIPVLDSGIVSPYTLCTALS